MMVGSLNQEIFSVRFHSTSPTVCQPHGSRLGSLAYGPPRSGRLPVLSSAPV